MSAGTDSLYILVRSDGCPLFFLILYAVFPSLVYDLHGVLYHVVHSGEGALAIGSAFPLGVLWVFLLFLGLYSLRHDRDFFHRKKESSNEPLVLTTTDFSCVGSGLGLTGLAELEPSGLLMAQTSQHGVLDLTNALLEFVLDNRRRQRGVSSDHTALRQRPGGDTRQH